MYIVRRKLEERERKRDSKKILNFRFRSYSKFNNLIKKKSVRGLF